MEYSLWTVGPSVTLHFTRVYDYVLLDQQVYSRPCEILFLYRMVGLTLNFSLLLAQMGVHHLLFGRNGSLYHCFRSFCRFPSSSPPFCSELNDIYSIYMNVNIALFVFRTVSWVFMMVLRNGFFRHRTSLALSPHSTRVTISKNMCWYPGMHIFIRFLHIRPFESHPFTISSIPSLFSSPSLPSSLSTEGPTRFFWSFGRKPDSRGFLQEVAGDASPRHGFRVIIVGTCGDTGTNCLRAYT
jgi:hypothetical protein